MENSIEKEFVPYQESLELKELGFDEPCVGRIYVDGYVQLLIYRYKNSDVVDGGMSCSLMTFSQAFDFFEKEHGIYYSVWPEFYIDSINFNWQCLWYLPVEERTDRVICGGTMQYGDNGDYPTRRLANIACLNKMIEIVKERLATQK